MIEHVKKVLADPKRVVPGYDAAQGYEIAGFVWLQGFNDMVDGHVYPAHGKPGRFDLYSEWLAHFIRDVRQDLGAPKMPFVIGVMGVGGPKADADTVGVPQGDGGSGGAAGVQRQRRRRADRAVLVGGTRRDRRQARRRCGQMRYFLDSKHKDHANADGKMTDEQKREHLKKFEAELISPAEVALWKRGASNAGYHYLGCAKTFALMGRAFAEALLTGGRRRDEFRLSSQFSTMKTTARIAALLAFTGTAWSKPLQVFILAGQSNMQGHAKVSTFEHIGMDPATKPMLAEMLNADGTAEGLRARVDFVHRLRQDERGADRETDGGLRRGQDGRKSGRSSRSGSTWRSSRTRPFCSSRPRGAARA